MHKYNDNGYEPEVSSYRIDLDDLHNSEMKLYEAAEFFIRPASPAFAAKQLARLSVVMARRSESNEDLAVLIDTYAEHLAEYPPDIIKAICDDIINHKKWFPLVSDMRQEADKMMKFRKAVFEAFQEKRNPLLRKKSEERRISADIRHGIHWKDLPRKDWLPQHYEWAIGECQDMLKLAEQNPQFMSPDMWKEKIQDLEKSKIGETK